MNCSLVAACTLMLASTVSSRGALAVESGPAGYEALSVLPHDPERGIRTEAVLAFRDLRAFQRWLEHHRRTLALTRAGAALLSNAELKESFGLDPFAELQRFIELAGPAGQPVPAALALVIGPAGPSLQLVVHVQPGFAQRLRQASAAAGAAPWSASFANGAVSARIGRFELGGTLEGDGWLRLAPRSFELISRPTHPQPVLEDGMRRWALDSDVMLLLRGGGVLTRLIAEAIEKSGAGDLVRDIRAAAVTWTYDGDRSSCARVLVDAPALEQLGPVIRSPEIDASLRPLWGEDAVSYVSVSVPPSLLAAVLPAAQRLLQDEKITLPDDLVFALTRLEGRVGYASFGSPDDWAVGVRFADAAVARDFIPALQKWLTQLAVELQTDAKRVYPLERFPGVEGEVIHIRPDAGLEGIRVAALGSTLVVVRQKSRLVELVERRGAAASAAAKNEPALALLTPVMQRIVKRPSMLLGYLVLSDDGSIMDYAGWAVSSLQEAWRRGRASLPQLESMDPFVERLPTLLALEGFAWSMLYDVGFSADLDGTVLVIELVSSEI